ncbi:MAG TPA: hypothetical protein VMM12_07535 [Longimicrobiales bacterium]|nr:hypothetical protein [Longimicrobiales bacterium]
MHAHRRIVIAIAALALPACGGAAAPAVQVRHDTVADTVIVRTVAGSQWGGPAVLEPELRIGAFEGADHYMFGNVVSLAVGPDGSMYVMDRQVPALRKYAADGAYVATFGREGAGPGEYRRPDGGLVTLPDGRVVLRDPGNARLQVYAPTGEALATIPIRGNFNTSSNMVVDTAGRVYTQILLDPEARVTEWRAGLAGYDPDTGQPVDTVAAPTWAFETPRLVAQRVSDSGTSTSVNSVPFSPSEAWALSPLGHMVGGLSTRYAVDQYRRGGAVLRIERVHEPVPVEPGEKADAEARARWGMRNTQPDWKWNGPAIPDRKPPFQRLWVGKDGRIWVQVAQPGERVPEEEVERPADGDPNPRPPVRWREPVAFDVFEPDGTYLGEVGAPRGFSMSPAPVFDGDRVWAVVRDELDVQYLTRFRVTPRAATEST